jgi:hypothetical protein
MNGGTDQMRHQARHEVNAGQHIGRRGPGMILAGDKVTQILQIMHREETQTERAELQG